MNFNPRSREGSDRPALAGGRTNPISIHAPVKGATQACRYGLVAPGYFNPRSREGSDNYACEQAKRSSISIHAPVKGATLF